MEEIKAEELTKEDIKFCIQEFKPEGFKYIDDSINTGIINKSMEFVRMPDGKYYNLESVMVTESFLITYYKSFLQAVIEGINQFEDYEIIQSRSNIYVFGFENFDVEHFEIDGVESKVKAIKYVIDKLRGII